MIAKWKTNSVQWVLKATGNVISDCFNGGLPINRGLTLLMRIHSNLYWNGQFPQGYPLTHRFECTHIISFVAYWIGSPICCPQFMTERLFSFQTNSIFFFPRRFRVHDYWARDNRCIIFLRDVANGPWVPGDIQCGYMYCFLQIFKDFYLRFLISLRLYVMRPWSFLLKNETNSCDKKRGVS